MRQRAAEKTCYPRINTNSRSTLSTGYGRPTTAARCRIDHPGYLGGLIDSVVPECPSRSCALPRETSSGSRSSGRTRRIRDSSGCLALYRGSRTRAQNTTKTMSTSLTTFSARSRLASMGRPPAAAPLPLLLVSSPPPISHPMHTITLLNTT